MVTTKINVKLLEKIDPNKYVKIAPSRNAKKKKAAIGWLSIVLVYSLLEATFVIYLDC